MTNPFAPLLAALNLALDKTYDAMHSPPDAPSGEAPECETCMGEKVLWIGYQKFECPTCKGVGTTWNNN